MTRDEAQAALNLTKNFSNDDVRARFQELYSDFQIRLTNAPTTALKKSYQKNLEELRNACEVLSPGFVFDSPGDFPSREPVSAPAESLDPRPGSRKKPELAAKPALRPTATDSSIPRSTIISAVAAAIFAALASFFFLKWNKIEAFQGSLAGGTDRAIAVLNRMPNGEGTDLKNSLSLLVNGNFRVCNNSDDSIKITALAATYRTNEDRYKTFNSTYYNWYSWEIPRNSQRDLRFEKDGNSVWDGSVLFYTISFTYRGNEYFLAGDWHSVKSGCVELSLQQ